MLSRQDSRRLAQLERQLWHDDPEFCIRMETSQPDRAPSKRPSLWLMVAAPLAWITALIMGVFGWWTACIAASCFATAAVAGLAYQLVRLRRAIAPQNPRVAEAPPDRIPPDQLQE